MFLKVYYHRFHLYHFITRHGIRFSNHRNNIDEHWQFIHCILINFLKCTRRRQEIYNSMDSCIKLAFTNVFCRFLSSKQLKLFLNIINNRSATFFVKLNELKIIIYSCSLLSRSPNPGVSITVSFKVTSCSVSSFTSITRIMYCWLTICICHYGDSFRSE